MATRNGAFRETNRVMARGQTYAGIDDAVNTPVLTEPLKTPSWWFIGISVALPLLAVYL